MPTLRAIIFDLDDTLLVDEAVSYEVLELIAQQVKKNCDIDPKIFVSDVATIAQELWRKGACYPFCHEIGISAFEGLWGNFLGETKELTTLRAWSHHYREEVFLKALLTQSVQLSQAAVIARDLALEFSLLRRQRQRLFPKTEKVLEQLSCHYQLGLLTNGAPDLQREKIVATRCEHLFSNILIS